MKPRKFKLRQGDGCWLWCYIWPTREDLHAATDKHVKRPGAHEACWIGRQYMWAEEDGRWTLASRFLGEVHFHEGRIDHEVVAHELTHHVIYHYSVLQAAQLAANDNEFVDILDEHGEAIATLGGRLNMEFWTQYGN